MESHDIRVNTMTEADIRKLQAQYPTENDPMHFARALHSAAWRDGYQYGAWSNHQRELIAAAQAVVDRWETPLWKDVPATAEYIYRLRDALSIETEVNV